MLASALLCAVHRLLLTPGVPRRRFLRPSALTFLAAFRSRGGRFPLRDPLPIRRAKDRPSYLLTGPQIFVFYPCLDEAREAFPATSDEISPVFGSTPRGKPFSGSFDIGGALCLIVFRSKRLGRRAGNFSKLSLVRQNLGVLRNCFFRTFSSSGVFS
jgi:hypothetical protein